MLDALRFREGKPTLTVFVSAPAAIIFEGVVEPNSKNDALSVNFAKIGWRPYQRQYFLGEKANEDVDNPNNDHYTTHLETTGGKCWDFDD